MPNIGKEIVMACWELMSEEDQSKVLHVAFGLSLTDNEEIMSRAEELLLDFDQEEADEEEEEWEKKRIAQLEWAGDEEDEIDY